MCANFTNLRNVGPNEGYIEVNQKVDLIPIKASRLKVT